MGHADERKMTGALNSRTWWSSLTLDLFYFLCNCVTSANSKGLHLLAMLMGFPKERVGIDFMSLSPSIRGESQYILDIVGYFTATVEAEPMKTPHLLVWRVPRNVDDEQDANRKSRLYTKLCEIFGISKARTTPEHPQGNGQVEQKNRILIGPLKAFTKNAQPKGFALYRLACSTRYGPFAT